MCLAGRATKAAAIIADLVGGWNR